MSPRNLEHDVMNFAPLSEEAVLGSCEAVCIGSGRFLRAVLVPALQEIGCGGVILAQPRSTSFCSYIHERVGSGKGATYEVDTVLADGSILTSHHPVAACGSLGKAHDAFMQLPALLPKLRYIGLGVTEAGIVHNGPSMIALAEFLHNCFRAAAAAASTQREHAQAVLSVLNTDNVPFNGDAVKNHVLSCDFTQGRTDAEAFESWVEKHVVFHNTMVDRITSQRDGDSNVPRAEPLPAKALVIEDLRQVLPPALSAVPGVLIRREPSLLALDIQLKLRVCNGLHTAMVYAMALHGDATTDACAAPGSPVLPYLEQLFERDIVHMTADLSCERAVVTPVYTEWLARLQHRHFGLSTFFIAQNASQKLCIRIVPSIHAALAAGEAPSTFVAFAIAAMLRFLTPVGEQPRIDEPRPVFVGRLDRRPSGAAQQYAPGLTVDLAAGSYEFADANGLVPLLLRPLGRPGGTSAVAVASITKQVLTAIDGLFARTDAPIVALVGRVADLLRRMLGGEGACDVLHSLDPSQPLLIPPAKLRDAVGQEVDAAEAIDVHAHCFAAEYGDKLMAFGVDKLLTAGYGDADLACSPDLVAQYLAISDDTPDAFAALPVEEQANRVWRALFVERSPLSEACLGVVTTLEALGLHSEVEARDLGAIRRWYATQDGAKFNEKVMRLAKLRYVVSSHSPFFSSVQLGACLRPPPPPPRYRAALEVDSLLEGDWARVIATLDAAGEPRTLRGVSQLLERCLAGLSAHAVEYISCSTPHTFTYDAVPASARKRRGSDRAHAWPVGADGPIAATSASSTLPPVPKRRAMPPVSPARASTFDEAEDGFDGGEPASPTSPGSLAAMNATLDMGLAPAPPSSKDVLDAVLLPLCRKYGLPLLLRMGTARQMNADLRLAGDGVGSARLDALTKLCAAHPNVKFLVTVLDAAQQHAAAVIASRFRNVHCWGSWWFSALPSVAAESSKMRVEMLGTQFTFAASSAKLHDQLIYKWLHGRSLLTSVLTDRYAALAKHGWRVSRGDIRRDVNRLLGGAYEEFIQKKL